jgi:hexosaminidase
MAAMAEVCWTTRNLRDWDDFVPRLRTQLRRYDAIGADYSKGAITVAVHDSFDVATWTRLATLTAQIGDQDIHYTLDGTTPGPDAPLYRSAITLKRTTTITAATSRGNTFAGPVTSTTLYMSPQPVKNIAVSGTGDPALTGHAGEQLIDNRRGSPDLLDSAWFRIRGKDFEAVLDLGSSRTVERVIMGFLHETVTLIFPPSEVTFAVSDDGITFTNVAKLTGQTFDKAPRSFVRYYVANMGKVTTRFIKVLAKNAGPAPAWHISAGQPTSLMTDEIYLE